MTTRHLLFALIFVGASIARAQTAEFETQVSGSDVQVSGSDVQAAGAEKEPVEITVGEGGEQRFENGVAIAEKDVVIHNGATSLYADYVHYTPNTHEMLLVGNVRVFQDGHLMVGDRALFNTETKLLRAGNFRGESFPFYFQAKAIGSLTGKAFQAIHFTLAPSDTSKPEVHLNAKTARIYPKDHITLTNVTVYVGKTPVFWFPYVFQSLKGDLGFRIIPGYNTAWGDYVLLRNGFAITDSVHGLMHLDLRTTRGAAVGLDANGTYGSDRLSWIHLKTYYAQDQSTTTNPTAVTRLAIDSDRYRISLEDRTFFTPDIYASCEINGLSDYLFLRDFKPMEYVSNPQPDNVVSLTKRSENYALTAVSRFQLNTFFDTTARLPEAALDVKRQPIFHLPIFYEGETSAASLTRDFGSDLTVKTGTTNKAGKPIVVNTLFRAGSLDYSANRLDSFHQLTMPETLGGWLSVVPRVGFRGTFYSQGATNLVSLAPSTTITGVQSNSTLLQSATGGSLFRTVFDTGAEASFKLTRDWDSVQSRAWGLDGLRHVFQPFADYSFVHASKSPSDILQFDRLTPSTQLPSIDFPQFTALDTITSWSILRMGMRNRLETRRDDGTMEWLSISNYLDYNLERPVFPGFSTEQTFSNLISAVDFAPLPWLGIHCDNQYPVLDPGFVQVNTNSSVRLGRNVTLWFGHRYLYGNKFFPPGSELMGQAYCRINDNWGVGTTQYYEFMSKPSQNVVPGPIIQEYRIFRDLSSWVVTLGVSLRKNVNTATKTNVDDTAVTITFTLKDLPSLGLPVSFSPGSLF